MKRFIVLFLVSLLTNSCESTYYPSIRPTNSAGSSNASERAEFETLIIKDKMTRNQRSAAVVNQLINDNPADRVAGLVLENTTNCNIIVRIRGVRNYTLPISRKEKNFLIIDKGNYTFSSNFCNSRYYKQKSIEESQTITLLER